MVTAIFRCYLLCLQACFNIFPERFIQLGSFIYFGEYLLQTAVKVDVRPAAVFYVFLPAAGQAAQTKASTKNKTNTFFL